MGTHRRGVAVALVVLAGASAQQAPGATAPAATPRSEQHEGWLRDLADEEKSLDAVRAFVRLGAAGARLLAEAMREARYHDDPKWRVSAYYALGKLGDAAASVAPLLLRELETAGDDVKGTLFWAVAEVAAGREDRLQLLERLVARKPQPGPLHVEWAYACRRLELGNEIDDLFGELLRSPAHADQVAAASVLIRRPPVDVNPPEDLLPAFDRMHQEHLRGAYAMRPLLELARAVVRHCPRVHQADAARCVLVYHYELEVRLDAAMQLGRSVYVDQTAKTAALAALRTSLTDGSVLVRREAVTSIGVLGLPAGKDALDALREDPDAQIRTRAAAALRSIERAAKAK